MTPTTRTDDPMPTSPPRAEVLLRRGHGTEASNEGATHRPADWMTVTERLRAADGVFWLSTTRPGGAPHVRPLFAAWGGTSFFVASRADAAKSRHLDLAGVGTISSDIGSLHLVVEGRVHRVRGGDGMARASAAMADVFGWPTRVEGDQLDADYSAPTSGGPPFSVYELIPSTAYGFPTRDEVEPTRWTFPPSPDVT